MDTVSMEELRRCAEDFVYFCENYVKIRDLSTREIVPFKLYEYQKNLIKVLEDNRFVISTKFRQGGFTTLGVTYYLWKCMFTQDNSIMFVSKKDRPCWEEVMPVMKTAIEHFPDWLKPNMEKLNDHQAIFTDTNSKFIAYAWDYAKGHALTHLWIDEAAFIKDGGKQCWYSLYPCIKAGGKVCVMSSTNGTSGWFYEAYTDALAGRNDFKVFKVDYTEHPVYKDVVWQKKVSRNLGERGWRQEVLQQFIPAEVWKVCDADEEKKFLEEFEPNILKQGGEYDAMSIEDGEEFLNYQPILRDPVSKGIIINSCWDDNIEKPQPEEKPKPKKVIKGQAGVCHQFKEYTKEEIQEIFKREHENWKPDRTNHPTPADPYWTGTCEGLADFWECYSEIYPEYTQCANHWAKNSVEKHKRQEALERRIDSYSHKYGEKMHNELLCMAGLMSAEEAKQRSPGVDVLNGEVCILNKVKEEGEFEGLELEFLQNRLCINGAASNITEEAICGAYFGLATLLSHEEAVDYIAKIIRKKLKRLF